jgi:hypothetical protein
MKSKTFIILFISFCVLAGVVYFNFSLTGGKARDEQMNRTLFDALPIEKISKIVVLSPDGAVKLARKKSLWAVENRFDYLADFSLITRLVSNIQAAKIGRSFGATPDAISRLGLHSPDAAGVDPGQKGIRVILKDAGDGVLVDVILGKTREMTVGAGGHYIMPVQGKKIYLVDKKFDDIGKKDADWIQKNVTDIKEQDIESVVCRPLNQQKAVYTLKRSGKEKQPVLQDMPGSPPVNPSKIDDVFTALAPLTIDDVAGQAQSDVESKIDFGFLFEYRLYNNTIYSVVPGQGKDKTKPKYYVKIQAREAQPPQKPVPESKEDRRDLKSLLSRTEQLMQNWVYEIPEWKFKRFIPKTDELLTKSN